MSSCWGRGGGGGWGRCAGEVGVGDVYEVSVHVCGEGE